MDAKDFIRIYAEECSRHAECGKCPFKGTRCTVTSLSDLDADQLDAEISEIISIAEKLNHKKTYADDFFEHYPNAQKRINGSPIPCREHIYACGKACMDSPDACAKCWNEPMPEEDK